MCLFLERERDLWPRGQSWGALGPYVGGLGPLLGQCWRSWAALGAYVGGLGPLLAAKLAVLGGLGAVVVGLGSDQGEKWPKPEREHDPRRVGPPECSEGPEARYPFLSIDSYNIAIM